MKSAHCFVLATALFATDAAAQYCPPAAVPGRCNPALQGNPLDTRYGYSFDTTTDFTYRTSLWDLHFERRFISNSISWSNWGAWVYYDVLSSVPAPFGKGPTGTGLRMWHSLYSVASHSFDVWSVRDLDGYQTEFKDCAVPPGTGSSCWTEPNNTAPSIRARLKLVRVSPTVVAPTLVQPDGLVLNYRSEITPSLFFLASVERNVDPAAPTTVLSIAYFAQAPQLPPTFTSPACGALAVQGIPFIKEVSFQPASNHKLYFEYGVEGTGVGQQCVLKKVIHHRVDGNDATLVSYAYANNGGGFPELVSRSNLSNGTVVSENYSYSTGFARYAFASNQGAIIEKILDPVSFKLSSSTGAGARRVSLLHGTSSTTCSVLGAGTCCNPSDPLQSDLVTEGRAGDGSGSAAQLRSIYYSMAGAYMSTHDMVLFRKADSLVSGLSGSVSPGTEEWIWRDTSGGSCPSMNGSERAVLWAFKNKRNAYTVTPHTLATPGNPPTAIEQTSRLVGAADSTGLNALESQSFTYSYGGNGEQRVSQVRKPSSLASGVDTITATTYDGSSSRVTSVITEGRTKGLNGVVVPRWVGTFYRTARSCYVPTSDSMRTLRIEGPCDVSSLSATACSGTSYPVTEFEYDSGAVSDNLNGRLMAVLRYPNFTTSACGVALQTSYWNYTPQGMPTAVQDESGALRAFGYSGELVTSMSIGTSTTFYEYEGSRLTKTTFPLGNYERNCYRTSSNDACTTGTLTDKVRWRAKYDTAGTWTERVEYEYATQDGSLTREVYKRPNGGTGEVRLEKKYDRDAHGRRTFEQSGSGSVPSMQGKSAYDGADNRIATSIPFAQAFAFCGTNPNLCRWMQYDRGDRLVQMDAHPISGSSSTSQRTCIEYDKQGNVRRTVAGCATSATCPIDISNNTGTATCNQAYVDYEVDDFGNTVAVIFPWTGNSGARGTTRYEYNALGNIVKKQTAEMAVGGTSVVSTYDTLGRLLEVKQMPSTQLLYSLGYDADETVESGCPALSYGNGRLTVREDSFGKTWFLYDEYGQLVKEVRRRGGLLAPPPYSNVGCSNGHPAADKNPHTSYSYNANGSLTSIIYPHGRTVNYVYPTTGAMDRPTSITYTTWNGSTWTTPTTLINNIWWEPYGALRAYQFPSSGQWVEYGLHTPPSSSTCAALPGSGWGAADGTGRLSGVFVSGGTFSPGNPSGSIFRQLYTWTSDQLTQQSTCHRASGSPFVETFGYDLLPRLTSKADVATSVSVAYGYDKRNNRTTTDLTGPFTCNQVADWWSAAWQLGNRCTDRCLRSTRSPA